MSRFIWRLEGRDGVGVYRTADPENVITRVQTRYIKGDRWPGPPEDGLDTPIDPQANWITMMTGTTRDRYGFANLKQARAWFCDADDMARWASLGVSLVAYRRDTALVNEGGHQVAFIPDGPPVARFPADALFKQSPTALEAEAAKELKL